MSRYLPVVVMGFVHCSHVINRSAPFILKNMAGVINCMATPSFVRHFQLSRPPNLDFFVI